MMRGLLLAMALCAQPARAQTAPAAPAPQAPTAAPQANPLQLVLRGQVLPALVLLESRLPTQPNLASQAAQFWALSGDVATAEALLARTPETPAGPLPDLSQVRPEPAIEAIVREAGGKRVVMINEAHSAPRHRAFSHRVMLALRDAGFTHFAAEAFNNFGAPVLTGGAPTVDTGFYTADPVFGDLARQAAAAGYGLVAYEWTPSQMAPVAGESLDDTRNRRDRAQAENLKAALDADPTMRVLVHVGFAHLNETTAGTPWHVFAGRLKELTGEDPLTIDQVEGTQQVDEAHDSLLYRAFLARFGSPEMPVAIANDPARPFGYYRVDLSVIHPRQREVAGRPDWLAMGGYRRPHAVALAPLGGRSLVRAFVDGEPAGAIPMDQMLVPSGAEAVTLMLPAGGYRLVRQTEAGEDLPLGELRIP